MSNEPVPIRMRKATDEDVSFIFNSWLKSFRDSGFLCRAVPNTIYFQNHHKIIQKILKRSVINIACNPQDLSQIYGYVIGEYIDNIFVLHYIYVKHSFRKMGVARQLYNTFNHDTGNASCCSHLTKMTEKFLPKYNLVYHPYVVLVDYEVEEVESEGSEVKSDRP
jgi:ribosomal protein S18 acetylase RimI-like enzyme